MPPAVSQLTRWSTQPESKLYPLPPPYWARPAEASQVWLIQAEAGDAAIVNCGINVSRTLIVDLTLGHVSSNRKKVMARTERFQVPLTIFPLPAAGRLAYS